MKKSIMSLYVLFAFQSIFGASQNVVTNGDFEMQIEAGARPPYWEIGFIDSPESYPDLAEWTMDQAVKSEGRMSLRIQPKTDGEFMVSQILNAPTYDLKGKTVHLSLDIRHEGFDKNPLVLLMAPNPELPPESGDDFGIACSIILQADDAEGQFQHYSAEVTSEENAAYLVLVLQTMGNGTAWFDNIQVQMDVTPPGPSLDPLPSPITNRTFEMGLVQENPLNLSEAAKEGVIAKAAEACDFVNLFFHVKWCALTDESIDWAHREPLCQADQVRKAGKKIALTLDFTHENAHAVGDLLPLPGGVPVGSLNDTWVKEAYIQEMLALCERVQPEYVIIGIEPDIFYDKHSDQWDAYVAMFKYLANTLTRQYPGIHVTAYFTQGWMVSSDATINQAHAAVWKQLLPELQSVAFSTYPEVMGLKGVNLASGFFSAAAQIAPDLPVFLPEFGVPGGPGGQLTREEQVALTTRIFEELSLVNLRWVCWFSVYDQTYLGVPQEYKIAFGKLGMHDLDGTAKPVWALWQAIYQSKASRVRSSFKEVETFKLNANYPNPFNGSTTIPFTMNKEGDVQVSIYNQMGGLVKTLLSNVLPAGEHTVRWSGVSDAGEVVSSGCYFVTLENDRSIQTKPVLLVK